MKSPALIYVAAGDTARNPSRSGIPTTVRSLVRELGQNHSDRARLAFWNRHRNYLHSLPLEFSLGIAAETIRYSPRLSIRERIGALPDWLPWRADERIPLHRHPAHSRHLLDSWLLLPELLHGDQRVERFTEYARRHGMRLAAIFLDALPIQFPEFSRPGLPELHRAYMRGLAKFDLILPISEVSAGAWRDFLHREGMVSPQIRTVELAAEASPVPRVRDLHVANGTSIQALCVSSVEPRKNHRALCEALGLLDQPAGALPLEIDMVGSPDPSAPALDAVVAAAEVRFGGRLRWHRQANASLLRLLYERADFTIYPSLAEGFGLPILESLWYGLPCICANFGVMAEHARGGGCLTTDVRDPVALANAIRLLATDTSLRRRLSLEAVQRPLRTWREYADDIVLALDEA